MRGWGETIRREEMTMTGKRGTRTTEKGESTRRGW